MKLRRSVKEREVVVLIDSGATHIFIHQALVEELGLIIIEGKDFGPTIGDGKNQKDNDLYKRVVFKLPNLTTITDFLVVELGRVHIGSTPLVLWEYIGPS